MREDDATAADACHRSPTDSSHLPLAFLHPQYWHTYVKEPTNEMVHEFILNQFVELWEDYDNARGLVPKGNLVEVAYADLAKDGVGTIGHIYKTLGLEGFDERVKGMVAAELQRTEVKGHKVNRFGALPPELTAIVAKRWDAYTSAWGYKW